MPHRRLSNFRHFSESDKTSYKLLINVFRRHLRLWDYFEYMLI